MYNHFEENLREQAYRLVVELPSAERPELIVELKRRCPGLSEIKYQAALSDALRNSR